MYIYRIQIHIIYTLVCYPSLACSSRLVRAVLQCIAALRVDVTWYDAIRYGIIRYCLICVDCIWHTPSIYLYFMSCVLCGHIFHNPPRHQKAFQSWCQSVWEAAICWSHSKVAIGLMENIKQSFVALSAGLNTCKALRDKWKFQIQHLRIKKLSPRFHYKCISSWLTKRNTCCICNGPAVLTAPHFT